MAALMIPGSKLTDILGRKRCFLIGLTIYGVGALVASASSALVGLTVGYSLLQGLGTALLIPPVYILATIFYRDMASRARAPGRIRSLPIRLMTRGRGAHRGDDRQVAGAAAEIARERFLDLSPLRFRFFL